MKKILLVMLSAMLVVGLFAGCSQPAEESSAAPTESSSEAVESPADEVSASSSKEAEAESGDGSESAVVKNDDEILIGVSFVSLQEERFVRERGIMEEYVAEAYPNAKMVFQGADYDPNKQYSQCENLMSQGIDALILTAKDMSIGAKIAEEADKLDIPVICYDEPVNDAPIDAFVAFSLFETGRMMAQYCVDRVPEGNYYIMDGDQTHYNANECNRGKMDVLQPLIDEGKIKIIGQQWNQNWDPEIAMSNMENALTTYGEEIDAVVCSNDGMAGGVVSALESVGLEGKVIVTGQDAELAACQRIVDGTQTMTVYKQIKELATSAIDTAVKLARGEELTSENTYNNGVGEVPAIFPEMISVDKDNMMDTVIADEWLAEDEVYENVSN